MPDSADDHDAAPLRARLIRNFNDVPLRHEQRAPLYDSRCARLAPRYRGRQARHRHRHGGARQAVLPVPLPLCPGRGVRDLEGEGTLRVAGERLPIRAGDTIFIPPGPDYPHQIINTSGAPLRYLSISTQDSPEICEYPDSGKYLATATRDGDPHGFARMHRERDDLDYRDGEAGTSAWVARAGRRRARWRAIRAKSPEVDAPVPHRPFKPGRRSADIGACDNCWPD